MTTNEWNAIDNVEREFQVFYCAFLDMLGYKAKSARFFTNEFNLPGRIQRATTTASTQRRIISAVVDTTDIRVEVFSDSIVILKPVDDGGIVGVFLFASALAANLGLEGLFVRGGISIGKHSDEMTDSDFRVLTSEALQKAYLLESNKAGTPRILIDPELIPGLQHVERRMVAKDGDEFILHYANHVVNRQGDNLDDVYSEMCEIQKAKNHTEDPAIRAKLQWLLDYYHWTIALIDGIDSERFNRFVSDAGTVFELLE
jgi:hypothetical protein